MWQITCSHYIIFQIVSFFSNHSLIFFSFLQSFSNILLFFPLVIVLHIYIYFFPSFSLVLFYFLFSPCFLTHPVIGWTWAEPDQPRVGHLSEGVWCSNDPKLHHGMYCTLKSFSSLHYDYTVVIIVVGFHWRDHSSRSFIWTPPICTPSFFFFSSIQTVSSLVFPWMNECFWA